MRAKCVVLFALLLFGLNLQAQQPFYSSLLMADNCANSNFLKYYTLLNEFEHLFVEYNIGEFIVESNGSEKRIYLDADELLTPGYQGGSDQGYDYRLAEHLRTAYFQMPETGSLKFFRSLEVYMPCNTPYTPTGNNSGGMANAYDMYWNYGNQLAIDDSRFVVEIVDSSTNQVISHIDSVGVRNNTDISSIYLDRYGIDPDGMNHIRVLPQGHGGTTVYIRVVPVRYGASPYGMRSRVGGSMVAMSQSNEKVPPKKSLYKFTPSQDSLIYNEYVARTVSYCDSYVTSNGDMPPCYVGSFLKPNDAAAFQNRYYSNVLYDSGSVKKLERPFGYINTAYMPKGGVWDDSQIYDYSLKGIKIYPQPADKQVTVDILRDNSIEGSIEIYDVMGGKVKTIWSGSINKGTSLLNLNVGDVPSGSYWLFVRSNTGIILNCSKILIK